MPMGPAKKKIAAQLLRRMMFERLGVTYTLNMVQIESMIDPLFDELVNQSATLNAAIPEPAQSRLSADQKKIAVGVIAAVDGGLF